MTNNVYISRIASFLPNNPVSNTEMEDILGLVNNKRSRAKNVILRSNGIKTRYYVIDPATGQPVFNNAELTAAAVRRLIGDGFDLKQMDCLACGTSSPDQILPNHAVMVHGELQSPPCEVFGAAGICVAGMNALKYAYLAVAAGEARNAVATGSEVASTFMLGRNFDKECEHKTAELESRGELAFEKDFLRWMLSDGAGSVLLQPQPNAQGPSLRIEWIDQVSYANELEACMYCGGEKDAGGRLQGWREFEDPQQWLERSVFAIKQDVRLLNENIVRLTVEQALSRVQARRDLDPASIDYFLPHYSSQYFRDRLAAGLANIDFNIPQERWFTNLTSKGNTGSASIYIMLDELFHSGRLQPGQRLLCYVPESGRFSAAYMLLTVV